MRTAFIKQLMAEAENDERIFLLVGDLGFSVVEPFANKFPDRFLNVGVAEQNMIGIASGLAMEGYTVFVYSIGNFPTLRAMEQIRYDVCYHETNVKIVAVGGGYAYGALGPSHHATEEIGMLRAIPNLRICVPGDPSEAQRITTLIAAERSPCYLRLGKAGEAVIHTKPCDFDFGKIVQVSEGDETAVLCSGSILKYAYDFLKEAKRNWGLYSVPFIKPFDTEALSVLAERYSRLITLEEHQMNGGLGSAVLENLNDLAQAGRLHRWPSVKRLAIPDRFISTAGSQQTLRSLAGLTLD
ncbi:transketolase [bacterium]|nr:transketolase [bacterium]